MESLSYCLLYNPFLNGFGWKKHAKNGRLNEMGFLSLLSIKSRLLLETETWSFSDLCKAMSSFQVLQAI